MLTYFDYIFYRIYSYYVKKNDDIPIVHSLGFLFIFQVVIVAVSFAIVDKITNSSFTSSDVVKSRSYISLGFIYSLVLIFDLIRYLKNKYYLILIEKFENNPLNKKIQTWIIFLQPIFLFVIVITFLILTSK